MKWKKGGGFLGSSLFPSQVSLPYLPKVKGRGNRKKQVLVVPKIRMSRHGPPSPPSHHARSYIHTHHATSHHITSYARYAYRKDEKREGRMRRGRKRRRRRRGEIEKVKLKQEERRV